MKNLFKTALFAAVGALVFVSCNKKDDFDYEGERQRILEQEQLIDAQLSKEAIEIEDYVQTHFGSLAQQDSVLYPFYVLEKKVKRGFWFEVLAEPTEEDAKAYDYKYNPSVGRGIPVIPPKVKVKYTARLLDGTLVESDTEGTTYDFGAQSKVINTAWVYSFLPYSIKYNGDDKIITGLIKNGLKKGHKIRVITPSLLAYGNVAKKADGTTFLKDIPANSIIIYEFEVLHVE